MNCRKHIFVLVNVVIGLFIAQSAHANDRFTYSANGAEVTETTKRFCGWCGINLILHLKAYAIIPECR